MNKRPADTQRLREAADWLVRLSQDVQSEADIAEWIRWGEADPKNLAALESLQVLWRGAKQRPPSAAALAQLLGADIDARTPWLAPPNDSKQAAPYLARSEHRATRLALAIAASILLLLGLGVQRFYATRLSPQAIGAAQPKLLQSALAQNQHALLADGSDVDLGASSSIDIEFTPRQRLLELRGGEAFFHVKHDKGRPFVVSAGQLQVVAVGTAFDVRRADFEVVVTVEEGVVEIIRAARLDPADLPDPTSATQRSDHSMRASAGDQLVFNVRTGQIHQARVDSSMAVAWRTGRLEFVGDSLDSVLAAVDRYTRRPIVLADPELGQIAFTGTIFLDSIDQWIDSLPKVLPVAVERGGSSVTLRSRHP